MTKIAVVWLMLLSATVQCMAQLPAEGDYHNRLGVDPALREKAEELYGVVFGARSPVVDGNEPRPVDMAFYLRYRQLMELAPYSDYACYSGHFHDGPASMYRRLLNGTTDPAVRMMLVEDVMDYARTFVDNLDSINVLRSLNSSTKDHPMSMPLAKIKRAHYNYMFAHMPEYYPQHLYDKREAYRLYHDAFKDFLASGDGQETELQAFYVQEYFQTCLDLYKTDEERYYEQFLRDYQEVVQVCDKLLIPYYGIPDSIRNKDMMYASYNYWTNAVKGLQRADGTVIEDDGVKEMFRQSGAADAARLKAYYAPRLEGNRGNKDFLDRAIQLMFDNGLTSDTLVYSYCLASHDLGSTYNNCIGIANYLAASDKDAMREYYRKALELPSSELQKAAIHYLIAVSLYTPRPRDNDGKPFPVGTEEYDNWSRSINDCNANLKLMLAYSDALLASPSLQMRDYVAQAYYMMGENNYQRAVAHSALPSTLRMAMDDISTSLTCYAEAARMQVRAATVNGRGVNVADRLDMAGEAEKKIAARLHEYRNNSAAKKAYDEYMRKRKAEEDFWKQK